jgi:hypothetical protein
MKSILTFLLVLAAGCVPAWAALGGNVSTVTADSQAFAGQHRMVAKQGYNLHQITTSDGSTFNEYATPSGVVFGVSWQSHGLPDFSQLLGTHMTDLQTGRRTHVIPRRGVTVQTNDFILISIGHDRFFHGKAYVPSLLPANLTPEVMK